MTASSVSSSYSELIATIWPCPWLNRAIWCFFSQKSTEKIKRVRKHARAKHGKHDRLHDRPATDYTTAI